MKKIRITAIRKVQHSDLSAMYENPIEHTCDIEQGTIFISVDGQKPEELCESAWDSMKNPHSAMISCNDGFRPVSFYIEVIE